MSEGFEAFAPVYVVGGALSLLGAAAVALVLKLTPAIQRDHPTRLILFITLCDVAFTLKFLVSATLWLSGWRLMHPVFCFVSDAWVQFWAQASIGWNLCWILDFFFILRDPLRRTDSNRRFYHLFVWLMAASTTGAVIGTTAKDDPDETDCLLKPDSTNDLVFVIPLLIYVSLGMLSLFYAFVRLRTGTEATRLSRKRLFARHSLYVIAFMFLWLWPILHHYFDPNNQQSKFLTFVDVVAASCQGFVFACIRLSEPGAWLLFKRLARRTQDAVMVPLTNFFCCGRKVWIPEKSRCCPKMRCRRFGTGSFGKLNENGEEDGSSDEGDDSSSDGGGGAGFGSGGDYHDLPGGDEGLLHLPLTAPHHHHLAHLAATDREGLLQTTHQQYGGLAGSPANAMLPLDRERMLTAESLAAAETASVGGSSVGGGSRRGGGGGILGRPPGLSNVSGSHHHLHHHSTHHHSSSSASIAGNDKKMVVSSSGGRYQNPLLPSTSSVQNLVTQLSVSGGLSLSLAGSDGALGATRTTVTSVPLLSTVASVAVGGSSQQTGVVSGGTASVSALSPSSSSSSSSSSSAASAALTRQHSGGFGGGSSAEAGESGSGVHAPTGSNASSNTAATNTSTSDGGITIQATKFTISKTKSQYGASMKHHNNHHNHNHNHQHASLQGAGAGAGATAIPIVNAGATLSPSSSASDSATVVTVASPSSSSSSSSVTAGAADLLDTSMTSVDTLQRLLLANSTGSGREISLPAMQPQPAAAVALVPASGLPPLPPALPRVTAPAQPASEGGIAGGGVAAAATVGDSPQLTPTPLAYSAEDGDFAGSGGGGGERQGDEESNQHYSGYDQSRWKAKELEKEAEAQGTGAAAAAAALSSSSANAAATDAFGNPQFDLQELLFQQQQQQQQGASQPALTPLPEEERASTDASSAAVSISVERQGSDDLLNSSPLQSSPGARSSEEDAAGGVTSSSSSSANVFRPTIASTDSSKAPSLHSGAQTAASAASPAAGTVVGFPLSRQPSTGTSAAATAAVPGSPISMSMSMSVASSSSSSVVSNNSTLPPSATHHTHSSSSSHRKHAGGGGGGSGGGSIAKEKSGTGMGLGAGWDFSYALRVEESICMLSGLCQSLLLSEARQDVRERIIREKEREMRQQAINSGTHGMFSYNIQLSPGLPPSTQISIPAIHKDATSMVLQLPLVEAIDCDDAKRKALTQAKKMEGYQPKEKEKDQGNNNGSTEGASVPPLSAIVGPSPTASPPFTGISSEAASTSDALALGNNNKQMTPLPSPRLTGATGPSPTGSSANPVPAIAPIVIPKSKRYGVTAAAGNSTPTAAAVNAAAASVAAAGAAAGTPQQAGGSSGSVSIFAAPPSYNPTTSTAFELISFADADFAALRSAAGLGASEIVYALDPYLLRSGALKAHFSEGASASFFCRSFDQLLVVKTIAESELVQLLKLLPEYSRFLLANPESLLCRFYGAFSLKMPSSSRVYFLLMGNVLPILEAGPGAEVFDLKGSTVGRRSRVSKSIPAAQKSPANGPGSTAGTAAADGSSAAATGGSASTASTPALGPDGKPLPGGKQPAPPKAGGLLLQDLEFRERYPHGLPACDLASDAKGLPASAADAALASAGASARAALAAEEPATSTSTSTVTVWPQDLLLGGSRSQRIVQQLAKDTQLLASKGLMDYSLLVNVVPLEAEGDVEDEDAPDSDEDTEATEDELRLDDSERRRPGKFFDGLAFRVGHKTGKQQPTIQVRLRPRVASAAPVHSSFSNIAIGAASTAIHTGVAAAAAVGHLASNLASHIPHPHLPSSSSSSSSSTVMLPTIQEAPGASGAGDAAATVTGPASEQPSSAAFPSSQGLLLANQDCEWEVVSAEKVYPPPQYSAGTVKSKAKRAKVMDPAEACEVLATLGFSGLYGHTTTAGAAATTGAEHHAPPARSASMLKLGHSIVDSTAAVAANARACVDAGDSDEDCDESDADADNDEEEDEDETIAVAYRLSLNKKSRLKFREAAKLVHAAASLPLQIAGAGKGAPKEWGLRLGLPPALPPLPHEVTSKKGKKRILQEKQEPLTVTRWSPLAVSVCALGAPRAAVGSHLPPTTPLPDTLLCAEAESPEAAASALIPLLPPAPPSKLVHPRTYIRRAVVQIGIVDVLQAYDVGKKTEHIFKSLRHAVAHATLSGPDISSIEPQAYANRFVGFVGGIFVPLHGAGSAGGHPGLIPAASSSGLLALSAAPSAAAPATPSVPASGASASTALHSSASSSTTAVAVSGSGSAAVSGTLPSAADVMAAATLPTSLAVASTSPNAGSGGGGNNNNATAGTGPVPSLPRF